jgi:hypothetical protein
MSTEFSASRVTRRLMKLPSASNNWQTIRCFNACLAAVPGANEQEGESYLWANQMRQ